MCFFLKRVLPCLSVFFVGFKFSMGLVWNLDSSWFYSLAFLALACFSCSSKSVLEFKIRSSSSLRPKRKNCVDLNGSHQNCSNWFWTPTRIVSYNVCFDGIDFQSEMHHENEHAQIHFRLEISSIKTDVVWNYSCWSSKSVRTVLMVSDQICTICFLGLAN